MSTKPKTLIQIVPSLPPAVDGIGDYALQLARSLRRSCGVETSFIVCDPSWPRQQWGGEFQAVGLGRRSASLLWGAMHLLALRTGEAASPVLLHFSPYGYQKRGCPFWLVSALEKVARKSSMRLNVAFHELDVNRTKPWSSTYWVPGIQRRLIERMLVAGNFCYTNTGTHRHKLEAWSGRNVALIPNFASTGEDQPEQAQQDRAREIVIFGRADQRRWTYEKGGEALARLCASLHAHRVVDIGSPIPGHVHAEVAGIPIERRGVLPAEEISNAMRGAIASFMYYPIPLLTKSSVYALSCASGAIPFIATDSPSTASCAGLIEGLDYIRMSGSNILPSLQTLNALAPAIASSYEKRSSEVAAHTIATEVYTEDESTPAVAMHGETGRVSSAHDSSAGELRGFGWRPSKQEVGL